jgi:hypothetical protein
MASSEEDEIGEIESRFILLMYQMIQNIKGRNNSLIDDLDLNTNIKVRSLTQSNLLKHEVLEQLKQIFKTN